MDGVPGVRGPPEKGFEAGRGAWQDFQPIGAVWIGLGPGLGRAFRSTRTADQCNPNGREVESAPSRSGDGPNPNPDPNPNLGPTLRDLTGPTRGPVVGARGIQTQAVHRRPDPTQRLPDPLQ